MSQPLKSVIATILVSIGANAGRVPAQDFPATHSGLDALKEQSEKVELAPTKESDTRFSAPSVYRTANGGMIFGGSITIPIPDEPVSFSLTLSFEIDLDAETYEVREVGRDLLPKKPSAIDEAPSEGGDYQTGTLTALLKERDPAWIELVQTSTSLGWTKGPGHPACADFSSGQCTPLCPTLFGTCWFMNPTYSPPCVRDPVEIGSYAPFETSTAGHYKNLDFGNPNLPTYVEHYDTVHFENGSATVYWDAVEFGEASSNLFATVTTALDCG